MSKRVVKEKIVVFDLDETLGNFVELGMFWNALEDFHGHKFPESEFFKIMDLFPEFLRPNITEIIQFLLDKKRKGKCNHLMIYTNNQGPKSWARMIGNYFDKKLGEKTFDRIIAAFKVHGKIVEVCRTSHDKSVKDFFRCTKIPENAEICFLDDQYHPLMNHERVFYINVKPYVYSIPFKTMAERYYDNSNMEESKEEFVSTIEKYMNRYGHLTINKDELEQDVDIVISKQIMLHLEDFFNRGEITRRTRRRNRTKLTKRNTRKKTPS